MKSRNIVPRFFKTTIFHDFRADSKSFLIFKVKLGMPHPDQVVETSSLASVEPPEIFYQLKMCKSIFEKSKLSALQLEAVVYACMNEVRNIFVSAKKLILNSFEKKVNHTREN
jgi:hypothetical protein